MKWSWVLTIRGDMRHVFVFTTGQVGLPPTPLAVCGKLVRLQLRGQWWSRFIPKCSDCLAGMPR